MSDRHGGMGVIRQLKSAQVLGVATVCSLFLLLGGCSSAEPDAVGSDDSSAAVVSGAQQADTEQVDSGGYTLPPRPKLATPPEPELTGDEQADALAVSRYFLEFYPYMVKTADVSYWQDRADASCTRCFKIVTETLDNKNTGQWEDGTISIDDSVAEKLSDGSGDYLVSYLVTRKNIVYYDADKAEEVPDGSYHVMIRIGFHDSMWKVFDFLRGTPETFAKAKEHARG